MLFFLAFPLTAQAELPVPPLTGPVVDQAGVFTPERRARLERFLQNVAERGHVQIQILTVNSLEGEDIAAFSIRVTDQWQIGDKKKDNGILIVLAVKDRRSRIEVGQGLEGDLPDIIAKRIQADVMRSYFKQGYYDEGLVAGVAEILKYTDPEFEVSPVERRPEIPFWVILLFFVVVIMARLMGFRGGRRAYYWGPGGRGAWGTGGFGGGWGGRSGGWSGGGGGFSGGGASDSW